MKLPIPCIVCGKELEPVHPDAADQINQPYGANAFLSYGHYGATVFDPMDSSTFLEINICSEDLKAAASKGRVLLGKTGSAAAISYGPFNPEA